ncbi:MAG: TAT-variant-translocated molybdopterin oxidoreductase [Acidobacteriota bacterium]|nr:TAT-variant-translocated molybdopterin oxidoreductase [Acidobacteriota bacterium]
MASKDSKTNFALLKNKILQQNGKKYWRSVEEFVDAPEFEEFVKYEYPAQAEEWDNSLSRRNFVKVMGASLALAGLSGCVIQPAEKIVPYVTQPEGIVPGIPLFFATAMTLSGVATGLLGRSSEGKPTKIEGHPDHPASLGATDVLAQASLLNLYDPDRSKEILNRGTPKTWQIFMQEVRAKVEENRGNGGAGIRFLTETVTSPTLIDQFKRVLQELPNAKWIQYEPVNNDNAMAGAKMAFGSPAQAVYKFDQAERILSLDADIFSKFNVRYIKDFSKGRSLAGGKKEMNRLYAIETTMSLTGAKADHRIAIKPSEMPEIAKAIAGALGVSGASSNYTANAKWITEMAKDLQASGGKSLVIAGDNQPPMVHALAFAMNNALGNVGNTVEYIEPLRPNADKLQREQLAELVRDIDGGAVKMLVMLNSNPVYNTPADLKLNRERLDKVPFRVHLGEHLDETGIYCHWHVSGTHYLESWGDTRAYDGTVSIVQPLIEPLYDSKSVYEVVQLFLEEDFDKKTLNIVQEFWQKQGFNSAAPTAGLTKQNSTNENAAAKNNAENNAEAATTATPMPQATATPSSTPLGNPNAGNPNAESTPEVAPQTTSTPTQNSSNTAVATPKTFEDNWRKVVHDGFVPNSNATTKSVSAGTGFLSENAEFMRGEGNLEIAILPDPTVYDGRFTNNGWLQELPKPLNKVTWENVALVSPNTAKELGINQSKEQNDYAGGELGAAFITTKGGNLQSDLLEIIYQGGKLAETAPAWITPGQPDGVITLFMGYGRNRAGRVGNGLGYNVFAVQKSDAMWFGKGSVNNTNVQTNVASTQIHFNISEESVGEREIILHMGMDEFEHKLEEKPHDIDEVYKKSMYGNEFGEIYEKHNRWAMTIDLNSCVGCNACVLACQSENNIPVVGKEQVERSREMHWMRIDAYYQGDDISDSNSVQGPHFQPVLCQQCEQAPCEVVCPVHATVHSAEGLNDMVYNRCIGTRYCSNNCPYKVRRFNFLLYQDWDTPQYKMMRNPEVTVRSRGVMEKCTYCTQRISAARIEAEKAGRDIRDGEIVTACQSVCPSDAIIFGDHNDRNSQVTKSKMDHRNYALLNEELNTQPRTTYLASVRNQNKAMPDYIKSEKKEEGGH